MTKFQNFKQRGLTDGYVLSIRASAIATTFDIRASTF
jgi:hypothetical protein